MQKEKLNVYLNIIVDKEIYPVPADDDVKTEIKDGILDHIHEQDGIEVIKIKILGMNYDTKN